MNLEQARFNMIEQQIRTWDVLNLDVLKTLVDVRREAFVPVACRSLAFMDTEIPLPSGQHMLSPKLEARLLQELAPINVESVLEIGTGSGYMAALLAHHAQHVTTVEIDAACYALATKNLSDYGIQNVSAACGDGARGWTAQATTYDAILLSGSVPVVPDEILNQLKVGGRLIAIIGEAPIMSACLVTRRTSDAWDTQKLFEANIAPLQNVKKPSAFHF
ncbi:MAG: protein-L-isoaspartate O-methyltransferase [Burkholderiales bacterium]|nr:protein-L-isoaspartate O-methyltransferase [Burkholderiales bacterium]